MNTEFKWTDDLVLEFISFQLSSAQGRYLEQFKASKQPKQFLFTTIDGKNIYDGDNYYFINTEWEIRYTGDNYNWVGDNLKAFSTKEKAEEYILWNKPLFSLKEIHANSGVPDTNPYFQKIVQIARNKMNNQ